MRGKLKKLNRPSFFTLLKLRKSEWIPAVLALSLGIVYTLRAIYRMNEVMGDVINHSKVLTPKGIAFQTQERYLLYVILALLAFSIFSWLKRVSFYIRSYDS